MLEVNIGPNYLSVANQRDGFKGAPSAEVRSEFRTREDWSYTPSPDGASFLGLAADEPFPHQRALD